MMEGDVSDRKFANQLVSSKDLQKSRGGFNNKLMLDLNQPTEEDEQITEN